MSWSEGTVYSQEEYRLEDAVDRVSYRSGEGWPLYEQQKRQRLIHHLNLLQNQLDTEAEYIVWDLVCFEGSELVDSFGPSPPYANRIPLMRGQPAMETIYEHYADYYNPPITQQEWSQIWSAIPYPPMFRYTAEAHVEADRLKWAYLDDRVHTGTKIKLGLDEPGFFGAMRQAVIIRHLIRKRWQKIGIWNEGWGVPTRPINSLGSFPPVIPYEMLADRVDCWIWPWDSTVTAPLTVVNDEGGDDAFHINLDENPNHPKTRMFNLRQSDGPDTQTQHIMIPIPGPDAPDDLKVKYLIERPWMHFEIDKLIQQIRFRRVPGHYRVATQSGLPRDATRALRQRYIDNRDWYAGWDHSKLVGWTWPSEDDEPAYLDPPLLNNFEKWDWDDLEAFQLRWWGLANIRSANERIQERKGEEIMVHTCPREIANADNKTFLNIARNWQLHRIAQIDGHLEAQSIADDVLPEGYVPSIVQWGSPSESERQAQADQWLQDQILLLQDHELSYFVPDAYKDDDSSHIETAVVNSGSEYEPFGSGNNDHNNNEEMEDAKAEDTENSSTDSSSFSSENYTHRHSSSYQSSGGANPGQGNNSRPRSRRFPSGSKSDGVNDGNRQLSNLQIRCHQNSSRNTNKVLTLINTSRLQKTMKAAPTITIHMQRVELTERIFNALMPSPDHSDKLDKIARWVGYIINRGDDSNLSSWDSKATGVRNLAPLSCIGSESNFQIPIEKTPSDVELRRFDLALEQTPAIVHTRIKKMKGEYLQRKRKTLSSPGSSGPRSVASGGKVPLRLVKVTKVLGKGEAKAVSEGKEEEKPVLRRSRRLGALKPEYPMLAY